MDPYFIALTVLGAAMLSAAWIPSIMRRLSISYSIFYVLLGGIIYLVIGDLPSPDPLWEEDYTVRLTELGVIVALMAAGLSIDKPFSLRGWKMPFRLVTITMLLTIAAVSGIAVFLLGFDLPSAILRGAVVAPTDPVLANDVQVAAPNKGDEDEVHFSLTAEAGINDGVAFPFTWLAIRLSLSGEVTAEGIVSWLWKDLLFRIVAGGLIGYVVGRIAHFFFFRLADRTGLPKVQMGFVGVGLTILAYALAELAQGYGFVAVFVAAVTLRNQELEHAYHEELHSFTHQVEHVLMVILLILFGGSLVSGLLDHLSWQMAVVGLLLIFFIRPVFGFIGLADIPIQFRRKLVMSFFGIRGIGSFFYLAFALSKAKFAFQSELWSTVGFIVLISIAVHGLTAGRAIKLIKKYE